jgi:hypothetical protein
MDPAGLPALLDAIHHMYGLEAKWLESVPVRETHDGAVVWDGKVQVFAVEHPKASRAYAWSHATEGSKRRFHVVLGLPPVDGPVMAVRAAIVADAKKGSG